MFYRIPPSCPYGKIETSFYFVNEPSQTIAKHSSGCEMEVKILTPLISTETIFRNLEGF